MKVHTKTMKFVMKYLFQRFPALSENAVLRYLAFSALYFAQGIVKSGEYLVPVMDCNNCLSPKKLGPNGLEVIHELMLSGFQSNNPIPNFIDPLIKKGFAMFYPDLSGTADP